ncbi:MAG TPA: ribosome rescue protein RqcH [Thermoplasmata archaeon]|nr:ribosome rescue protein RqcH [Thermoplasmata archaeon]
MELPAAPVKDRFTALDTLALSRELRALVGGRLDKAFTVSPRGVALVFRAAGVGRRELRITSGRFAWLGPGGEHADELDPLAKEIRRVLSGAQLVEVGDPLGERYLELVFRRPDSEGPILLGVELFGHGNLVVARDGRLIVVEHARRWAHRSVRIGADYQRPPTRTNPWAITSSALGDLLRQSRTDRASTLAARLGLGGPLAEELLARAHLDGTAAATAEPEAAAADVSRALGEILREVGETPRGFEYLRDGVPLDVLPVRSVRWTGREGVVEREHASFSEAAEAYFSALPPETAEPPSARDEARDELERQAEQQRKAVDGLRATIGGLQAQAEAILAHYSEFEAALAKAGDSSDERVELTVAEVTVPVLRARPLRESAQFLFEEAKRLKGKLAGTEAALRQSEERLQLARDLQPRGKPGSAEAGGPAGRRRALHWFERYRWFISSEGILVIGGRDAPSNDLLVRRYLNPSDLYVHADIHGAPSVIVKHPPPGEPGPTEPTLREAGQFGFAFSKAWRAGLASGDAFWVTPDQVSKSGASGEFVARGAWVIHGTKNFLRDLPAELALGQVSVEGSELWTVAPPSAIAARGTVRFLLSPGDERERANREVELSRESGISRDRLQALLPAGGITFRRA